MVGRFVGAALECHPTGSGGVAATSTMISLLASLWVYDLSGLYELPWLETVPDPQGLSIINVNAGFDETSMILQARFPGANFQVLDFYDPDLHTEVSIRRARKALPPFPGTISVATDQLPLPDESADHIFAILSAHEIRNESERARFFEELARLLKPGGRIYVTEHLRDLANLLVYNIGFLHFHSRRSWFQTFETANLQLVSEVKTTPFISTFILLKQA